jgi:hypothetical protein
VETRLLSNDKASGHGSRLFFSRRTYKAIGLLAVVSVSIFVYAYYSLGASSVTGLTVRLVFADRMYVSGTFPNRTLNYFMEVQVWSITQTIDVQVTSVGLAVDDGRISLGNVTLDTGMVRPNSKVTYNFRFNLNENRSIAELYASAITLTLTMNAQASAGFYSQLVARRDSVIWNWTTATGIWT